MDTNTTEATQTIIRQISDAAHVSSYSAPVEIGAWLACLFFIIALVNQAQKLVYSFRGKPTPSELTAANAALDARLARIETKLDEQDRRLGACEIRSTDQDNISRTEHDKLYRLINTSANAIARIEGMLTSGHRKG